MLRFFHSGSVCKFLTLSALFTVSLSIQAATIFSEDFETAIPGLGVVVAGQFTAINNSNVDVLGPGNTNFGYECLSPESGQCVDLGGSASTANNDGDLIATVIAPSAGVYYLSFNLVGSSIQQSPATVTTVTLGSYSQSFVLPFMDAIDGIIISAPVTLLAGANTIEIKNTDSGSYNGSILDNVVVTDTPTPEPVTAALFGSALLLASAFRKRSVR
jgi:hypothetical protein